MKLTRHQKIISNYRAYVEIIKPHILACTDSDMKQYMLYFLYVRAKMVKIDESYPNDVLLEILEDEIENGKYILSIGQSLNVRKGYTDTREIGNREFTKKTGIIFYTEESNTAREFERELVRIRKSTALSERVELLKRLVRRKKDVTVDAVLEYFRKHDVGMGRTKFYKTRVFKVIMSDLYKNGKIKVLKKGEGYICK